MNSYNSVIKSALSAPSRFINNIYVKTILAPIAAATAVAATVLAAATVGSTAHAAGLEKMPYEKTPLHQRWHEVDAKKLGIQTPAFATCKELKSEANRLFLPVLKDGDYVVIPAKTAKNGQKCASFKVAK